MSCSSSQDRCGEPRAHTAQLPEDALGLVFRFVSAHDLANCMRVCRAWNNFLMHDDFTWKCQMEHMFWQVQAPAENRFARSIFRGWVTRDAQLAQNLQRGCFVGSSDSHSWLLCGHARTVHTLMFADDNHVLTFGGDGDIRSWRLPFQDKRPPGNLMFQKDERIGRTNSAIELGSGKVAIAGDKGVAILFYWQNKNNVQGNSSSNNNSNLSCRVIQYLCGHKGPVYCLCSDGSQTLVSGCADGIVRAYRVISAEEDELIHSGVVVKTGEEESIQMRGHKSSVNAVCLGCDDKTILSCSSDQTIRIWHFATGECHRVLSFVGAIAGTHLVGLKQSEFVQLYDSLECCSVRIHRLSDGEMKREISTPNRINATCLRGRRLLCGTVDGSLVEYDVDTGEQMRFLVRVLASAAHSVYYLHHHLVLAVGEDGQMLLINLKKDGSVLREIRLRMQKPGSICYSPRHRALLVTSGGYLVRAILFED